MPDKVTMPIEATHIMMFARAIGDNNRIYHDPKYGAKREPDSIIAPPTFARSMAQFDPNHELRLKHGKKWFGSGKNPSGLVGKAPSSGGLHAEQHFEYHRHIKPGDQLSVTSRDGNTWEKESRRAGKLKFAETVYEFHDQNGDLVITMRSVVVHTEKPVE